MFVRLTSVHEGRRKHVLSIGIPYNQRRVIELGIHAFLWMIMRVPCCLKPSELEDLVKVVFDSDILKERSSLIRCPECTSDFTCTLSRASRWPVWFFCVKCKFAGDLLQAAGKLLRLSPVEAGEELLKLEPNLKLPLLLNEHNLIQQQIRDVNCQWSKAISFQSDEMDSRGNFLSVSQNAWQDFMRDEVVTRPVTRRGRPNPKKQRLLCKVYSRPGLPVGLRYITGPGHDQKHLACGIAFMNGGCQLPKDPVGATILTKDALWAINLQGRYWTQFYRPAPILMPFGKTDELRRCFGDQVNWMVAWSHNPLKAIRLAMENDCRVTLLENLPSSQFPVQQLAAIVEKAMSWEKGLSRLIVSADNVVALLSAVPPIPQDRFSSLSIRARRRISTLQRAF